MVTKSAGGHSARLCRWFGACRAWCGCAEDQGAAGFAERLGDVGRAVVAHHTPARDALAVEPGDSPAEEADQGGLLLVRQHLDGFAGVPFGATLRGSDARTAAAFRISATGEPFCLCLWEHGETDIRRCLPVVHGGRVTVVVLKDKVLGLNGLQNSVAAVLIISEDGAGTERSASVGHHLGSRPSAAENHLNLFLASLIAQNQARRSRSILMPLAVRGQGIASGSCDAEEGNSHSKGDRGQTFSHVKTGSVALEFVDLRWWA